MSKAPTCFLKQPIAIVGIATELPSGPDAPSNLNYEQFIGFLLNGGEAYEKIPGERFNIRSWAGNTFGRVKSMHGTFLKEVTLFDHVEFGISGKDARAMAPSARKLIETSFLSLLDAGVDYRGRNIGCYAAGTAFDVLSIAEPDEFEAKGSFAGTPSMIANRISYHLDLQGPSVPTDTACSSSLTALHLAVQAIRAGECEAAVVAGCQLNLRLADFVQYSQASILAEDGKCKPFDVRADGFSRGEGTVAVVLKPYEDAVRDGDHIYANILGTGINSCGGAAPVHVPVGLAQADAMHRAYQGIGRNPREVDFFEMHATGTAVGDPIESEWVGEYFSRDTELYVGSVKGNIGHLEITAFLASLCKACSIIETGIIPPNVNLAIKNPAIKWDEHKLKVPVQATPIKPRSASGRFLISISSFGIGGSNGHAVIESPSTFQNQDAVKHVCDTNGPVLLVAGGLSPRSTTAITANLGDLVCDRPECSSSLSIIYGRRARQMTWRSFAVARPGQQPQFSTPALQPKTRPPMVFLFSGQGPQHINMGRQLFRRFRVFRDTVIELDFCHHNITGVSLIAQTGLYQDVAPLQELPSVWPISVILPSITMVQIALFELLSSFGLRPDLVMGHSSGETAMLYASGAGSKTMAMEIAIARGRALTLVEQANGAMAALTCTPAQSQAIIHAITRMDQNGILEIACYNAPEAVVIAGHVHLVDRATEMAESLGFLTRKIQTRVAVHSSLMEICQGYYSRLISEVYGSHPAPHRPLIPTFSTATGAPMEEFTESYFWQNSRSPVLFSQTVQAILNEYPTACFVEMSPHPVLSTYLQELGVSGASVVCPMLRSKKLEQYQEECRLLDVLGRLVVIGYNCIDFRAFNSQVSPQRISLPLYPFVKKRVPYLPEHSLVAQKQYGSRNGPLNSLDLRINKLTHPDISDHVINDEPIMPAAGFLEMILEAGAKVLWGVKFHSILSLSAESPIPIDIEIDHMHWTIKSRIASSKEVDSAVISESTSRLHAEGYMSRDIADELSNVDLKAIRSRCQPRNMENFYDELNHFAKYGPLFRRITAIYIGTNEALVTVRGDDIDLRRHAYGNYIIHPAILDACIHLVIHPTFTANPDQRIYYLPARVECFVVHDEFLKERPFPSVLYAFITLREWRPSELISDIAVIDSTGKRLCTMSGLVVERHYITLPRVVNKRFSLVYQPRGIVPRMSSEEKPISITTRPSCPTFSTQGNLPDVCRVIFNHLIRTCCKKTIRILAIDDYSPLFIQHISSSVEEAGKMGSIVTCFIGSTGSHYAIQPPLPQSLIQIPLDWAEPTINEALSRNSFDIVIGLQDFISRASFNQDFQRLGTLLVPGGFILLAGESPDNSRLLERGLNSFATRGLQPIIHTLDTAISTFFVLEGQNQLGSAVCLTEDVIDQRLKLILSYNAGQEMGIQRVLKELDPDSMAEVWFVAVDGVDGDAGKGFTRSLRREFPLWVIGLAIFEYQCSLEYQRGMLYKLFPTIGDDQEIFINRHHQIFVPRYYEVSKSNPSTPWNFRQGDDPELPPFHVRIQIIATSSSDDIFYALVGRITEVEKSLNVSLVDTLVAGIVKGVPTSASVVAHKGFLITLSEDSDPQNVAKVFPALMVGGLAVGLRVLQDPSRMNSGRVVITHSESSLSQTLLWFFNALGLHAVGVRSNASPLELFALRIRESDLVISSYCADDQTLVSFLTEGPRLFHWKSSIELGYLLLNDPWLIGDILETAKERISGIELPSIQCSDKLPMIVNPASDSSPTKLFKSNAVYLLVGGAGSLGLHIAVWMYERGARHIVLTSRSGRKSLERASDTLALRMLSYLESQSDMMVQVEASDASSLPALQGIIKSLSRPIAGCMLLSVVLSDRGFLSQTAESFETVSNPKVQAFETLEAGLQIENLDFLITFSSVATFGNAGQTNYASANTVLEGKTRKYNNAFAVITPAITDTLSAVQRDHRYQRLRHQHLMPWAYSARELCDCLEDGIFKLKDGPIGLYVPDLDWNLVQRHLGSSPLYDHLARRFVPQQFLSSSKSIPDMLRDIVLQTLDVNLADFSPNVPLTSYGLDSLSAGKLSYALRPLIVITQIQLLGGCSLDEINTRIKDETLSKNIEAEDLSLQTEDSETLLPLVKITDYEGHNPLILLHGASGSILPFISMKQKFQTSVWALQTTPDTPIHSISEIAQFYYKHIKAERPYGPYRLGVFSATSTIIFIIARLFEASGDEVVQLCLFDHFPLLWVSPLFHIDEESVKMRSPGSTIIRSAVEAMLQLYRTDNSALSHRIAQGFEDVLNGLEAPLHVRERYFTLTSLFAGTYEFLFSLLPSDQPYSVVAMRDAFIAWLKPLRAPVTLYMASKGCIDLLPNKDKEQWEDLGVRQVFPNASIVVLEASHLEILETRELADSIQSSKFSDPRL